MNISQLPFILRKPVITIQTVSAQFLLNRAVIFTMASLQLLWLFVIAATGTSTKYGLILLLSVFSIIATLGIISLPTSAILQLRDLKKWLLHSEKRLLLVFCLAAILIGFSYASSQHVWGDESDSTRAAHIIASEGIAAAYQKVGWLGNQHPPLIPWIYALILKLPGADLLALRMVSVFFLAGLLSVTYFLGRELYGRNIGYFASILLLSFPLVIRLGASAMLDIPLSFFFCLALLLLIRLSRKPSYWLAGAAGAVVGLGLLTKYMMILLFVVILFYALLISDFRKIRSHLLVVALVAVSMFTAWLLYANHMGILSTQFQKILNYTGSYHVIRNLEEDLQPQPALPSTQEENADQLDLLQTGILRLGLESLFTRIPSSLGVHYAPLIIFGLLYLIKGNKPVSLVVLLWIGLVSVSLFLTLPDHRYFLPIFPAIAIVVARVLLRFPDYAERTILIGLLFGAGNLYLFINWVREAHLFMVLP